MDLSALQSKLVPDQAVALRPPNISSPLKAGPLHKVQFVIEFVSPKTTPAALAAAILSAQWYSALGEPQAFSMTAADTVWQPLSGNKAGSYDSLALAWDYLGTRGELTSQAAKHLLTVSEQLAVHLNRRAIPMPPPEDVDAKVRELKSVRDNFDAGFTLLIVPQSGFVAEADLWICCANLGLSFGSTGSFDWVAPGVPQPLFSVTPLGGDEEFSLGGVQRGNLSEGALLGFSLPRCPDPSAAFEGMVQAADFISSRISGAIFDENDVTLGVRERQRHRQALSQAVAALSRTGIAPGSPEAIRLWPG